MKPYRNQKLRDLANEAPHCMYCKTPRDGTIVLAHSNLLQHGKGTSQKSQDFPAYVCAKCHREIDGAGDKWMRHEQLMEAGYWSVIWLLESGHLEVK